MRHHFRFSSVAGISKKVILILILEHIMFYLILWRFQFRIALGLKGACLTEDFIPSTG